MTIESMILARILARRRQAVVDFEDATAPIADSAQDAQQGQASDLAAHEMHFDDASIPAAVSASDDATLPADWQLPPKGVKRRKGKGSK
jgi:hypothetical protein